MKSKTFKEKVVPYLKTLGFKLWRGDNKWLDYETNPEMVKPIKIFGVKGYIAIDSDYITISVNSEFIVSRKTTFLNLNKTYIQFFELPLEWSLRK